MVRGPLLGILPLVGGLVGSVAPDVDHLTSIISKNKDIWGVLHSPYIIIILSGISIALYFRHVATFLLDRK
jgi:hypothetical protein